MDLHPQCLMANKLTHLSCERNPSSDRAPKVDADDLLLPESMTKVIESAPWQRCEAALGIQDGHGISSFRLRDLNGNRRALCALVRADSATERRSSSEYRYPIADR